MTVNSELVFKKICYSGYSIKIGGRYQILKIIVTGERKAFTTECTVINLYSMCICKAR